MVLSVSDGVVDIPVAPEAGVDSMGVFGAELDGGVNVVIRGYWLYAPKAVPPLITVRKQNVDPAAAPLSYMDKSHSPSVVPPIVEVVVNPLASWYVCPVMV